MSAFQASGVCPIVGESARIRQIKAYLPKVAACDCSVLITGETGTGKERVAEAIHFNSSRRNRPLVCINTAALPDTLLESELFGYEKGAFTGASARHEGRLKQADGGTVFLDEIGDMSPFCQAKVLRAIENKEVCPLGGHSRVPVNVRFIAATNHELDPLVADGKFRKDLYYRLNVVCIRMPALRDRAEDIPLLIDHYIRDFSRRCHCEVGGPSAEALAVLTRYDWPGNIRELKNLIEAIFIDPPDTLSVDSLPEHMCKTFAPNSVTGQSERDRLISALVATDWNKSKAAHRLQWSRMTLYRKLEKYQIRCSGRGRHPSGKSASGVSL
ncbi:regulatory protein, Fis family [Burkholderia sp. YR290]|nr:regulatory protein, Fis family [Burkholderia sp. YR290]